MLCVNDTISHAPYNTSGWRLYMEQLSYAVFDIETTGLSSSRDAIILGGLLTPGQDGALIQYLASSPAEEVRLLESYLNQLSSADLWISYNGDTFDRPFLARRLRKYGLAETLPLHQSLDLYRIFRCYSPMASLLPDLRQSSVEAALGLSQCRSDTIDGRESVRLYEEYARSGSEAAEKKILLHNRDDLLMLHRLMCLMNKLDLHKIMFQRGFMVKFKEKRILSQKITMGKNFIELEGHTQGIRKDHDVYTDAFRWTHQTKDGYFQLYIPCLYEKKLVFLDLEAFPQDLSPLVSYPAFVNGYLVLHDGTSIAYRETNHLIKIILTEILNEI